jgi:hypothetical protein
MIELTMLKVHGNVVAADVGGHGDDGCGVVELSDKMCGRNTVEIGHDNVHEDEIVLCSRVQLVHRF